MTEQRNTDSYTIEEIKERYEATDKSLSFAEFTEKERLLLRVNRATNEMCYVNAGDYL